jgi:hypothetical protein
MKNGWNDKGNDAAQRTAVDNHQKTNRNLICSDNCADNDNAGKIKELKDFLSLVEFDRWLFRLTFI